jgi:hypothetical protein
MLARGSVTSGCASPRARRGRPPRLNPAALDGRAGGGPCGGVAAERSGLALAPMSAADILSLRGVLEADAEPGVARPEVSAALSPTSRRWSRRWCGAAGGGAGARRGDRGQIDAVAARRGARGGGGGRAARSGALLRERVEAVLAATAAVDEARLAQELALIAVKADVTEELDRLDAHVAAARALVTQGGPVGRKLDFLMQEFNREANTLCAKAQSSALTAIGLEMKVVIDQMREQVQNVE